MGDRQPIPNWIKCEVIKRNIFEYGDFTCEYCFEIIDSRDIEFDHMDPVAWGGENEVNNIVIACKRCNGKKGSKPYHTFISSIENYVRLSDRAHMRKIGFFTESLKKIKKPHV